jgi:hypothetical protein
VGPLRLDLCSLAGRPQWQRQLHQFRHESVAKFRPAPPPSHAIRDVYKIHVGKKKKEQVNFVSRAKDAQKECQCFENERRLLTKAPMKYGDNDRL